MARPTEPGWYWLNDRGWKIVKVEKPNDLVSTERWWVLFHGESTWSELGQHADDQWGGRITQEPVIDPPPPF